MACINQLPNELIAHILSFLDQSSPLAQRLYDDPAGILDDAEGISASPHHDDAHPHPSLKSASLVCRLWRDCTLPLLFRHVVWQFQSLRRPQPSQSALALPELAWLRFLGRNALLRRVRSLAIIITTPASLIGDDVTHHVHAGILPSHLPPTPRADSLQPSVVGPAAQDNNWLWQAIFAHLDPTTLTLVASPAVLASLLGRPVDLCSAWLFRQRYHIISLSRDTRDASKTQSPPPPPPPYPPPTTIPCHLFGIREWSSLLINEGSSVKAYATYDYFNYAPPSLLRALLDPSDPSTQPLVRSLTSLSYIAIFPLATHVADVLGHHVPPVSRFFVQIVPRDVNFAHRDYRHPGIDINDLWIERNSAYSQLAMAVFDVEPEGGWEGLQVFESGDSVDREAWEQAVRFVVHNAGTKWQVGGDGMFIRRH